MVSVIAAGREHRQYVGGGAMALGMGGMMLGQIGRGKRRAEDQAERPAPGLPALPGPGPGRVRRAAAAQREALEWVSPDPRALPALLVDPDLRRVWERRPSGGDFAKVRIGTGTHRLAVRLVPPETKPVEDLDPLCAGALRRFVRGHGSVPGLPVGVSLRSFARIAPAGEPRRLRHAPGDDRAARGLPLPRRRPYLRVRLRDRMRWWQWIKWLPHNMHPTEADAAGPVRLMAPSLPRSRRCSAPTCRTGPVLAGRSPRCPFTW